MADDAEFWFCLKHHTVEGADGCRAKDRLGPYESREAASHALERVEERNEEWDNDPAWNDAPDRPDPGADDDPGR